MFPPWTKPARCRSSPSRNSSTYNIDQSDLPELQSSERLTVRVHGLIPF